MSQQWENNKSEKKEEEKIQENRNWWSMLMWCSEVEMDYGKNRKLLRLEFSINFLFAPWSKTKRKTKPKQKTQ